MARWGAWRSTPTATWRRGPPPAVSPTSDVPVIGAGTYANNRTCALSATGVGEEFIKHTVTHDISALMEYKGLSLQQAMDQVIHHKLKPGDGGVIGVAHDGALALVFNSEGMYRGAADSNGRFEVRIWE